ncbi:hypothetical protein ABZ135_32725 [Streptomyces sp. NPDC006339]|uniref:hypothetical protein n=1 Tax=Streptomyces sp. NPDC006339 TaxID=3156755 RepID=UPI0033B98A3A
MIHRRDTSISKIKKAGKREMVSGSVVVVLTLLVAALVKFGAMKFWQPIVGGAWGYYLATSSIGPEIGTGLGNFFNWFGTLSF